MDATYKTTKYDLPLFIICVKTNVGYITVAEFIVQSENSEEISNALFKLKEWNPGWKPAFFMTDYSEAELMAIERVFPETQTYLCDFHREQAWERWVSDRKHGLVGDEADELLKLLRECAHAPSPAHGDPAPQDSYYQMAVERLKNSNVWNKHENVQKWLEMKWLSIPQVCCIADTCTVTQHWELAKILKSII